MIQHRFGDAEPGTLGVEEELFFVDAGTLDAAAGFSRVVGEGDERVKAEVFESLVELATPVVPDAGAALAELTRMRAEIAGRAAAHGLRIYGAGAHPLASDEDQEIVPLPRYEQMASALGDRCPHPLELRESGPGAGDGGSRELDEALEDLGLDALVSLADHAREARGRIQRRGIDEEELLLDPQRPGLGAAEPVLNHLPRTACTGRPAASQA